MDTRRDALRHEGTITLRLLARTTEALRDLLALVSAIGDDQTDLFNPRIADLRVHLCQLPTQALTLEDALEGGDVLPVKVYPDAPAPGGSAEDSPAPRGRERVDSQREELEVQARGLQGLGPLRLLANVINTQGSTIDVLGYLERTRRLRIEKTTDGVTKLILGDPDATPAPRPLRKSWRTPSWLKPSRMSVTLGPDHQSDLADAVAGAASTANRVGAPGLVVGILRALELILRVGLPEDEEEDRPGLPELLEVLEVLEVLQEARGRDGEDSPPYQLPHGPPV